MVQFLQKINIRQDYDRIRVLFWSIYGLLLLGILTGGISESLYISMFVNIGALTILYYFLNRTLKKYYYTFWSLSFVLSLYVLSNLYSSLFIDANFNLIYIYLLSALFLVIELYALSSPIYFPIVSWWEYDFRYRTDFKITLRNSNKDFDARIVDLRRFAIGVQCFESLKPGEDVVVVFKNSEGRDIELKCEIVSRRIYSIGRPYMYGLRIEDMGKAPNLQYMSLFKEWKSKRRLVRQRKFSKDVLD